MSKSQVQIDEEYLGELIAECGKRTVGKLMKRHDLFGSNGPLKSVSKEIVYEGFREFRDLILAHNKGLNISIMQFKTKGTDSTLTG